MPLGTLTWAELPKLPNGRLDKAAARALYEESPHIEWVSFCKSVNWDPRNSRNRVPAKQWVEEKRARKLEEIKSNLKDFSQTHRAPWLEQVKSTLTEYPKAVDNVMMLVQQFIMERAGNKVKKETKAGEIAALAQAVKTCVEAKKSILMLDKFVAEVEQSTPESEETKDSSWVIAVRNNKNISTDQLQTLMLSYQDKPLDTQPDVIDVDPEPEPDANA